MVTVKLGADGAVELYASAGCPQMIIDVAGWYASGQPVGSGGFVGVSPARALDTREAGQGPCVGSSARKVVIAGSFGVPADAGAVALNVTVVSPTAGGFATVWPSGDDKPWASNLNYVSGDVVPNMVTVKLGADGAVELYASAGCPQMIIDVAGWYASGQPVGSGGFVGVSPARALDTRGGAGAVCRVICAEGGDRWVVRCPCRRRRSRVERDCRVAHCWGLRDSVAVRR